MKENLFRYFAYQMMAIGIVGRVAASQNWVIGLFAVILFLFGMTRLRDDSPWLGRATVSGGLWVISILLQSAAVLPPNIVLSLELLLSMTTLCMLCMGLLTQVKTCGAGIYGVWQEIALIIAFTAYHLLAMAICTDAFPMLENVLIIENTLGVLAHIGLILDLFRVQKIALAGA